MSLEQGILGFLSMAPLSGYEIKKLFDMSASYFWPANQTQIYRTLKAMSAEGLVELKERTKGETVDKNVYAITDQGQRAYLKTAAETSVRDFISHDAFLMQLFFSGALPEEELLVFFNAQLQNIKALEQRLINNYSENYGKFKSLTRLDKSDPRMYSAECAYRWGLIKCREYAKLLEKIKKEIEQNII